jgi:hypothetical protein
MELPPELSSPLPTPAEHAHRARRLLIAMSICEGVLSTHTLPFYFLYLRVFRLDLLSYNMIENCAVLLLCLKPLLGFLTTRLRLFGSHLRNYLVLTGLLGMICYSLCANPDSLAISLPLLIALHLTIDLINACRSVLIDSLCVIAHNLQKATPAAAACAAGSVTTLYGFRFCAKICFMSLFSLTYHTMANSCSFKRHVPICRNFPGLRNYRLGSH